jgi:DNA-binding beta-propeller fold protein YncE
VAGIGPSRYNGDDIPAFGAGLSFPTDVLSDGSGNLYITDTDNHRVRRVDAVSGLITTVAGYGERGFTGDGGAATEALLNRPWGVARDPAGNLYIAEHDNHRIRERSFSILGLFCSTADRYMSLIG